MTNDSTHLQQDPHKSPRTSNILKYSRLHLLKQNKRACCLHFKASLKILQTGAILGTAYTNVGPIASTKLFS